MAITYANHSILAKLTAVFSHIQFKCIVYFFKKEKIETHFDVLLIISCLHDSDNSGIWCLLGLVNSWRTLHYRELDAADASCRS